MMRKVKARWGLGHRVVGARGAVCVCERECGRGCWGCPGWGVVLHLYWSLEELFLSGPEPGDQGFPPGPPGLSSSPQPWLLESAYSCLVPHAQMWACVPTQVGAGHALGEGGVQEGSWGQPGGEGLCAHSLPLLAPLGRRGEDEVCRAPPPPVWCPSSSLELGKSPVPAPECEALGVLVCLPSVARR